MTEAYRQGFMKKCAENGVNPATLVKMAQWYRSLLGSGRTFVSRLVNGGTKGSRSYQLLQKRLGEMAAAAKKNNDAALLKKIQGVQGEFRNAAWNNSEIDSGILGRMEDIGFKGAPKLRGTNLPAPMYQTLEDYGMKLNNAHTKFRFGQGVADDLGKGLMTRVGTGAAVPALAYAMWPKGSGGGVQAGNNAERTPANFFKMVRNEYPGVRTDVLTPELLNAYLKYMQGA